MFGGIQQSRREAPWENRFWISKNIENIWCLGKSEQSRREMPRNDFHFESAGIVRNEYLETMPFIRRMRFSVDKKNIVDYENVIIPPILFIHRPVLIAGKYIRFHNSWNILFKDHFIQVWGWVANLMNIILEHAV